MAETRAPLWFGGDYNPEQWSAEVIDEDIRLMREAGVTVVTLGVFSWGLIETADGVYDFAATDRIVDRLHHAGIAVDLATPTAAPPMWLHHAHPEILPVTRTGQRYAAGGRLGWCASSPVWRRYALRIVEALATRYGRHPAVRLWHLGNELGGGNRHCYCDESAAHFRRWLHDRYGDVDAVNAAWGTAFWGHRYGSFDEILPPRDSETVGRGNPGLVLDYDRFSSDALLEHYLAERDVVRRASPGVPVTTNFMVGRGPHPVDYARWAREVDVVATDHYLIADDPHRHHGAAFAADRTRGLDPHRPWLLMETAAGAVSWQPVNRPPEPGEVRRAAYTHLARGADGILFFQWRQSASGAEQFHSGMVPHAGPASRTFREVAQLGRELARLGELTGTLVEPASVAVLADDEAVWAWEAGPKPVRDLPIGADVVQVHRVLFDRGVRCDVLPPDAAIDGYRVVVVPALFLLRERTARRLAEQARSGGTVLVTRLTGVVDETNTVLTGGSPALLRELLGVRVEEVVPLLDRDRVRLADGTPVAGWAERLDVDGAEVVLRYAAEGTCAIVAGGPALTRRTAGDTGSAWYLSAALADDGLGAVLERVMDGVVPLGAPGLDVVRRTGPAGRYLIAVNHSGHVQPLCAAGTDLLTGQPVRDPLVDPGGVIVVREEP